MKGSSINQVKLKGVTAFTKSFSIGIDWGKLQKRCRVHRKKCRSHCWDRRSLHEQSCTRLSYADLLILTNHGWSLRWPEGQPMLAPIGGLAQGSGTGSALRQEERRKPNSWWKLYRNLASRLAFNWRPNIARCNSPVVKNVAREYKRECRYLRRTFYRRLFRQLQLSYLIFCLQNGWTAWTTKY